MATTIIEPSLAVRRPTSEKLRSELAHLAFEVGDDGAELVRLMSSRLEAGRALVRSRFEADGDVDTVLRDLSGLIDGLVQGALDLALRRVYQLPNPTLGEQLSVVAVGGYGRGELAPGSDVDLLFLYSYKRTPHTEQLVEFLLYQLWDLGLKVGHATRSIGECIRAANADTTICTALLDARLVWGMPEPFETFLQRYEREIVAKQASAFIEAKLSERDARHLRVGDSRFLLEPNVKEGKGGIRDMQTLEWLGKFLYRIEDIGDLVAHGVLTSAELRAFRTARRFLWTARCHMHMLTGRAEERLTFDLQPKVAARMGFRDRPSSRGVERFMKRYYLVAKDVGALTRSVCAALEEQHKRRPILRMPRFGIGRRVFDGLVVHGDRISLDEPDLFERDPASMLRLFHLAQAREIDVHPQAVAAVRQNLKRVNAEVRADPEANRLFLEMLTSPKDPAMTLGRMNDAGLLGRFVPDFGRVVAQMQYDLYHVYTVDEHTIQAIGVLNQIERGQLADELPLATELLPKLQSRTELFVATFVHDLGKGRGGDHSEVGAGIAERFGARLGLSPPQIETVVWLVRHHLLLSRVAFKRDLEDPKTIVDLVAQIQSPERLRLLLVLTAADIRAVGPHVWNGWKGQLLREVFAESEAAMVTGDLAGRRAERIEAAKARLRERLLQEKGSRWTTEAFEQYAARHDRRYWLAFDDDALVRHARFVRDADSRDEPLALEFEVDAFRARTQMILYAEDHPGLFMRVAGALALSGASIVDARIFTTDDGMAFDVFGFQDADSRQAVGDPARLKRIKVNIDRALKGSVHLGPELRERRSLPRRADVFQVEPRVLLDNKASRTHTVIELNGRDRPGLLRDVSAALRDLGLVIGSAHISTYGERVVDVFYVKDVFGLKISQPNKLARVQDRLREALAPA